MAEELEYQTESAAVHQSKVLAGRYSPGSNKKIISSANTRGIYDTYACSLTPCTNATSIFQLRHHIWINRLSKVLYAFCRQVVKNIRLAGWQIWSSRLVSKRQKTIQDNLQYRVRCFRISCTFHISTNSRISSLIIGKKTNRIAISSASSSLVKRSRP